MGTLMLKFKKLKSDDETKYRTFYSSSNTETIVKESDLDDTLANVY